MSSIDERIVRIKFDNAQFASGVDSTMKQLHSLNTALKMEGATQGLNDVSSAASKFSLQGMKEQVSGMLGHFSALQVAAVTALSNIVNKAVTAGLQIAKSLSVEPVMAGFREYETNLSSIQTVLANTGLKGAEGLSKVNDALQKLNDYSDQTIYNFSQMAKNVGTFTAAGVSLDVATSAIKGIANLAAISGSNAEQASTAMYQLSQAISAGKVSLEDWNSVVNAGMGGKVFQDSLIETAKAHGVAVDDIIKKSGSFRMSLQEGWLTSGILTETLSKFTGELTADQLKSMGYTEQQIAGIIEMGKTATDAATKVKSMTQLLDTLREAVGSGWAKTWQIVFGNFDEAKSLFTEVNETLGAMIKSSADARNNLLQGWKDLGGRAQLIEGISNAFNALMSILKPIKDAFREIFPATTAKQLYDMTVAFSNFMEKLIIGEGTANNLRRTFAGFFAILGIGWELIKAGVSFIFDLIGSLTQGSSGFLNFTGNIGDFLVSLHKAIKEGELFTKFFDGIGKVLAVPIKLLQLIGSLISALFDGLTANDATDSVNKMTESLKPLERIGRILEQVWDRVQAAFTSFVSKLDPASQKFVEWARSLGEGLADAFSEMNFETVLGGIQTGLFAGLLVLLKKFLSKFGDFSLDGGFLDEIKTAIGGLTGALKGMQNALNAAALLLIATAVGILTLSLIGLSHIDSAGLARASVAIAVMFTQLGIAFAAFSKLGTTAQAFKIGIMAAGLILLATAVRVLASSVEKLGALPLRQLQKGLFAVTVLLATLVAASNRMSANTGGIIRTAASLVILGVAIKLLASSVKDLGEMDWSSLAKGLTGVGALLGALVLFTKFVEADKGGIAQGAGIVLLATGLKILASAVEDFTKFNWEQIARGMSGIAIGLGLITVAMNLLPQGSVLKAAGLAIVAASLNLIADAVKKMSDLQWAEIARGMTVLAGSLLSIAAALRMIPSGSVLNAAAILIVAASLGLIQEALGKMSGMSWEQIAKGLITLAGSLIIIAAAVRVMQGALSGAAAILVVAAALRLLIPVLTALGEMTWEEIIKGLVGLAGVFLIIGAAGLILGPLVPVIFGLAAGIALLGLAVLAAGLGVLAFATALTVLAAAGTAAVAAVVGIVAGLVGLIPYVMEQIALGLVAFAKVIAVSGPAITEAIVTVLNSLLDAIIQATPKIMEALKTMLFQMLDLLVAAVPKMVEAGFKILLGFLEGIAKNIGKVVDVAVKIVVEFIGGISRNLGKIIQAGFDLVISFMNGIANAIRDNATKVADAGFNIAKALIEGVVKGIGQLIKRVVDAAINMAKQMWNAVANFFGVASPSKKMIWFSKQLMIGVDVGLKKYASIAVDSMTGVGEDMVDSMGKSLTGLSSVLGSDLIDFEPTISPVLDLTQVKKSAGELANILSMPTFNVESSVNAAQTAGAGFEENRSVPDNTDENNGSGDTYNYTQYNNSPKALTSAEIYRQTKNLISKTKGDSNVK